MSEEEYYKPTLIEPKDLDIEGTDYNDDLNVIKEGNTIKVTMDQDVMIQRVSHEIYSNAESGIRELINNEYRACRQARDKYNAKPRIEITIDARTRQLTIEGIDSLGISVRVFDKVLRRLGVSGNVDGGNEIGQFGMGFASYTTLSELITVETYSREDNQEFAFLGDRGIDFKILPKPERETFGTKILLTCKDSVDFKDIRNKVKECALFSTIPTNITILDDGKTDDDYDRDDDLQVGTEVVPTFSSGKEYCRSEYRDKVSQQYTQYDSSTRALCDNGYAVGYHKEIHIDNDDYEFYGILSVNKNGSIMSLESNRYGDQFTNHALLVNTPIQSSISPIGKWTVWYLNVKNERKYVPTADRDRLKDESSKEINAVLNENIKEKFKGIGLGIESISDYNASLYKPVLKNLWNFTDVMDTHEYSSSKMVMDTLDKRYPTVNQRRLVMSDMIDSNRTIVVLKSLRADLMARLENSLGKDKSLTFIRWRARDIYGGDNVETVVSLMNECGVVWGEQYLKENKVKGIKSTKISQSIAEEAGCVLYHKGNNRYSNVFGTETRYYVEKYSTTVGEVNEKADDPETTTHRDNIMQVTKEDWHDFFDITCYANNGIGFAVMKPRKGISDNIQRYTDVKEEYKTRKFLTLGSKRQTIDELFIAKADSNIDRGSYSIALVVCPKDKAEKISELFTAEDIVGDGEYNHVANVIFCESNKELLCLTTYMNQLGQTSSKEHINIYTSHANNVKRLFDKDSRCSNIILTHKGVSEWEGLIRMENFRRTVPDNIYQLLNVACSQDNGRGMEFIQSIYDYGDEQRHIGSIDMDREDKC
jgi:hypothetical protein